MPEDAPFSFAKHHATMVVGVLDIASSTELTLSLTGEQIDDFYNIFLRTLSDTLHKHGASVLKNMGDGLLFYFPQTAGGGPQSLAYAAEGARGLLAARDILNKKLNEVGLPAIDYRISMSLGPVSAMLDAHGRIIDLFGAVVSTCAKMNKLAKPNTAVVGEALNEKLAELAIETRHVADFTVRDGVSFGVYELR